MIKSRIGVEEVSMNFQMDIIKNEGNLLGVYDVLEMGKSTSVGFQVESGLSFVGEIDI